MRLKTLLAELRQRGVLKVATAYLATGWLVLEGVSILFHNFEAPTWVLKVFSTLVMLGFPLACLMAWGFEFSPHGVHSAPPMTPESPATPRRADAFLAALLVLTFGLVTTSLVYRWHASSGRPAIAPATVAAGTAASRTAPPSIAVLPFKNRSRLEDDVFFVDGIHDDILTQLSKVSALKVISRASVEQFRDTTLPVKDIAAQLGVTTLLEGGVQRAGDRVRINVQLIDAGTDAHLWAESYDRELTAANLFAIQSEVAAAIAAALKATLTAAEHTSVSAIPTHDLGAWEAYQLGRQRLARRTHATLLEAEAFFRKAIDRDPLFALAYVGLADTLVLQVDYGVVPRETGLERAEQNATRGLQLDSQLAQAWTSSAMVLNMREQYDRAEPMFRRAIELNPNYSTAHQWYSGLLAKLRRGDQALVQAQIAVELDPLSAIINLTLGDRLENLGKFGDAEARYRKAIEIDPLMPGPHNKVGLLQAYARGRPADGLPFAARAAELDPGTADYAYWLGLMLLDVGDDAEAARVSDAALERWPANADVSILAAATRLYRGDGAAATRLARQVLEFAPRDPRALLIVSDADLATGDYRSARLRYAGAYPELLASPRPEVGESNAAAAIDLVPILQKLGENERADVLLAGGERAAGSAQRLGPHGNGLAGVAILALRGQRHEALSALRDAQRAGWRGPFWRYHRDFYRNYAAIRDEPEFKAVFADIARDMDAQRARLARHSDSS